MSPGFITRALDCLSLTAHLLWCLDPGISIHSKPITRIRQRPIKSLISLLVKVKTSLDSYKTTDPPHLFTGSDCMCVCVDTYARVDVHFTPKGTSKGVPFRSRPQRLQWAGQTGRQPPANDPWVCCSLPFRPRSPAADWAQWAMKSRRLDLSLQGAFAQAFPLVVLAQTVRLALQARAFSVLLSSFFCL